MSKNTSGILLVIIAVLMFGSYGIFLRLLPTSPVIILFFNQIVGMISFFIISVKKGSLKVRGMFLYLFLLSVFALLNDYAYFNAFKLTTIANSVLTHYTAPILVALFAPILLQEKFTKNVFAALSLSSLGLILIVSRSGITLNTDFLGISLGLLSGFMYALFIIMMKKLSKKLSVYTINFYRYFTSSIILTPLVASQIHSLPLDLLGKLLGFGLIFAVLATGLHTEGIKRVYANQAAILGYLEPVSALLYALVIFSEVPSILTIFGGLMILTGSYLTLKRD